MRRVIRPLDDPNPFGSSREVNVLDEQTRLEIYKMYNAENADEFDTFLESDREYANYRLDSQSRDVIERRGFEGLNSYGEDLTLNGLNMDLIKSKLAYLSENQKSMLIKHDFRTVNRNMIEADGTLCSLAGFLREDVQTLRQRLEVPPQNAYASSFDSPPVTLFKELTKRRNIVYMETEELTTIGKLNDFITSHLEFMDSKNFILTEWVPGTADEFKTAYLMKIRRENSFPDHSKILVDFKQPGFLNTNVPNPLRVTSFVKNPYNSFRIYYVKPTLVRD